MCIRDRSQIAFRKGAHPVNGLNKIIDGDAALKTGQRGYGTIVKKQAAGAAVQLQIFLKQLLYRKRQKVSAASDSTDVCQGHCPSGPLQRHIVSGGQFGHLSPGYPVIQQSGEKEVLQQWKAFLVPMTERCV